MTLPVTHDVFDRANPDHAEMAVALERDRQARHLRTHGTLDEYVPSRDFPCPGLLSVVDDSAALHVVACDVCGFETAIRPGRERVAANSPERAF